LFFYLQVWVRAAISRVKWGFVWPRVASGSFALLLMVGAALWAISQGIRDNPEEYLWRATPLLLAYLAADLFAFTLRPGGDE
jgi:uncharacterized membrane protein YcfT